MGEVTRDRDRLASEVGEVTRDRDRLASEVGEVTRDRDRLASEVGEVTRDRDRLASKVGEVTRDRHRLAGEAAAAALRAAQLETAYDGSVAERNSLAAELADAEGKRISLQGVMESRNAELAAALLGLRQSQQDLAAAKRRLGKLKHSAYWRATGPLRSLTRAIGRPLRRRWEPGRDAALSHA